MCSTASVWPMSADTASASGTAARSASASSMVKLWRFFCSSKSESPGPNDSSNFWNSMRFAPKACRLPITLLLNPDTIATIAHDGRHAHDDAERREPGAELVLADGDEREAHVFPEAAAEDVEVASHDRILYS